MTEQNQLRTEVFVLEQMPEQTAREIASMLDFLRREAATIGMHDVSEILGRACKRSGKYSSPH